MQMLEDKHSNLDLLDELHKQVLSNDIDGARITAAKIEAIKDIKFSLLKAIKENESKS